MIYSEDTYRIKVKIHGLDIVNKRTPHARREVLFFILSNTIMYILGIKRL